MSTQYQSKEHSSEHSKEFKKEEYTTNQGKTDVVIERVQNAPVVVEHHHHHTHTIVHPEVVREHDTTEIRQVIKPLYEQVKVGEKEEYAGKEVRVVEKAENTLEAQRKLEAQQREIQARADVTHTEHNTTSVDSTRVKDVHAAHKVIEEVTPVIIRDVEHNKTIHKDEKVVEKIHHAPEVVKEEREVERKERDVHLREERTTGLKEGRTTGLKEERTTGLKEERTTGLKEGHTAGLKEGHTRETHGLKLEKNRNKGLKEGRNKDKTKVTTKGTGLKEEQVKETRIRKNVE